MSNKKQQIVFSAISNLTRDNNKPTNIFTHLRFCNGQLKPPFGPWSTKTFSLISDHTKDKEKIPHTADTASLDVWGWQHR